MKSKFYQFLIITACALSVLGTSISADAHCYWVPRHYNNGYLVRGHNVCTYNHPNRYYRHCNWQNGHKVCWN